MHFALERTFPLRLATLFLASAMAAGCIVEDDDADGRPAEVAQEPMPPAPAPAPPYGDSLADALEFVVDISDRKLYVIEEGDTTRTEPVAVGTAEHPTPTGEWAIHQVDWNPDWTPPPGEEWTEDEEPQPPGSPDNPMGRARLVFQMPYTIHGTRDLASLGKAASHGSIRVANDVVVELGRLVMEAGGATRPESFFQEVRSNRTRMYPVEIPRPVPVRVQQ